MKSAILIASLISLFYSNSSFAEIICNADHFSLFVKEKTSTEIEVKLLQKSPNGDEVDSQDFQGVLFDRHGTGLYQVEMFKLHSSSGDAILSLISTTILANSSSQGGGRCQNRDCSRPTKPQKPVSEKISTELLIDGEKIYLECGNR